MDDTKKARSPAPLIARLAAGFGIALFVFLAAAHAQAASLYFIPNAGSITVGQVFSVTVAIASPDQAMNAASGDISFPADKVHVISVSKTNSIINEWVRDPSFSNSAAGIAGAGIYFEGIVLNPGYMGNAGNLIRISFQAIAPGNVSLVFASGTVLANDGNATEILDGTESATFTIAPAGTPPPSLGGTLPAKPAVISMTHPDENSWYSIKTLQLSWALPDDITGVSYALSTNQNFDLPEQSKGVLSSISYDLSKYTEGQWYFLIKFANGSGWGPVTVRKVNIDFTPPSSFVASELAAQDGAVADPTDPQPLFTWSATDTLSGVSKYMVKIGNGNWFDAKTIQVAGVADEYRLPLEAPAENIPLIVDAYDQAGNMTNTATLFSVEPLPMPQIDHYSQQLTTQEQLFTADGTVATGIAPDGSALAVTATLKKGNAVLAFTSPVDQDGHWAVSSTPGTTISPGLWHLSVQLSDARGALSLSTSPVPVNIGGWFANLLGFFLEWGIAIAFGVLLVGGVLALAYFIHYRLQFFHLSLDKKMIKMKEELRGDLKRLEKDIEDDKSGRKWARKEIEHLEDDIKNDIKELK